ncbi:aarF domain-containing kinase 4, putative [Babesia ovis]|uniref:AarF domain-containing kinase 4, putative n=1 Tax=Babesia ovis TaxID=5869 RepID=A0A9W5TCR2_BABOV|nr:aarF domain-containing kinase 4, putative [Babesia ovis]
MRITRTRLSSQLNIYRDRNLYKFDRKNAEESSKKAMLALCLDIVDCAQRTLLNHKVTRCSNRKTVHRVREDLARNTSPDEMNATKYDINRALRALGNLKDLGKRTENKRQSMKYSTWREVRTGISQCAMIYPPLAQLPWNRLDTVDTTANKNYLTATNMNHAGTTITLTQSWGCLRQSRNFSSDGTGTYTNQQKPLQTDARKMNQNLLPADRYSRAATIAGFMFKAASLTAKQAVQRYLQGERKNVLQQSLSSDENVDLLVDCLCQMRGTALKFGQLLSLQYGILPERIRKALVSVRHRADVMPEEQVKSIMQKEFGTDWESQFKQFNMQPIGSASLGQVHEAVTADGAHVCVKIQFPGVAESIDSDIANLIFLCTKTKMVPKSFFLNQFAKEIKVELTTECDYENEANFYRIFRQLVLDGFKVPSVIDDLSSKKVITTEFVTGVPIEECRNLPQEVRDSIGDRLLRLSLSELFIFGLMNTDPNPSNYLYDKHTDLIGLIDFGSCRSYSENFVSEYFKLVQASVNEDVEQITMLSKSLGFINDDDSEEMVQHHAESVLITGQPFRHHGRFDFEACDIIQKCRKKASVILKIRKQPPPPEVYSLHRKLAGCYVMCNLIGARVDARNIYLEIASSCESSMRES